MPARNCWFLVIAVAAATVSFAADAPPTAKPIRIVLVGDSTVASYAKPPEDRPDLTGWGQVFGEFFNDRVTVLNHAQSGASSKSFIHEGRWQKALAPKGDYVFIQFGHNDCPGKGDRSTDPNTDFQDYLRQYIDEARVASAKPILVTPVARRTFANGKIHTTLQPYADAMLKVGKAKGVPVIDLHAASMALFSRLGDQGSADLTASASDRTHFSRKGARAIASLVADALPKAVPELQPYLKATGEKSTVGTDTPGVYQVSEDGQFVRIETPELAAAICKKGYVSGVASQSFLDKKTGFRDPGFGLDIVDWIMEPGSDVAYRDRLDPELIYHNEGEHRLYHGSRPKRSLEGPQICTKAAQLQPTIIRGKDFVAIRQQFTYRIAAPGRKTGSVWTQLLVFPVGKRFFISMDRIDAVNSSEAMFLRVDMPGHVRHSKGDTFSEIYLSYRGRIPAAKFLTDFPPDAQFDYRRDRDPVPDRFIRGYRLRDPATGKEGPWLLGMTLEPSVVWEAWCHQRGYVCMIEEFGGRPIQPGQSFSAAFLVGYSDSLEDANRVYDAHKGHVALEVTKDGWKLAN